MRYLGLDVGARRIGVAVGETLAAELTTIIAPKDGNFYEATELAIQEIGRLKELEEADAIVVGLPVDEDGQPTEESKKISDFSKKLETGLGCAVHFVDETLTSFMAEELLAAQDLPPPEVAKRVHQAAAQQILQQYLEEHASL
ncbi:MAG: Holliday junction resolvase RuvX [Patescibacteria group bacterium]